MVKTTKGLEERTFTLTDKHLEKLEIHCKILILEFLEMLDSDYRFHPGQDSNWPVLGYHFIDLLVLVNDVFRDICEKMVSTMLVDERIPRNHPHVLASLVNIGEYNSDFFKHGLEELIKHKHSSGLIFFPHAFTQLGDHFSTLWALRMIIESDNVTTYKETIDDAVKALEKDLDYMLSRRADFVGFFLYLLVLLDSKTHRKSIDRCIHRIMEDAEKWINPETSLRVGAFVALDFLNVSKFRNDLIPQIENWLTRTFELKSVKDVSEFAKIPSSFKIYAKERNFNDWLQGWMRATITAVSYLKLRGSEFNPAPNAISRYVQLLNGLRKCARDVEIMEPLRSAREMMESIEINLGKFWKDSPMERSVFIMYSMIDHKLMKDILKHIRDVLKEFDLVARYVEEGNEYDKELWTNNVVYMYGCKYGIAILEAIQPEQSSHGSGLSQNVLIEYGFMKGKGADILVLRDKNSIINPEEQIPSLLKGSIRKDFSSHKPSSIKRPIRSWIRSIGIKKIPEESEIEEVDT